MLQWSRTVEYGELVEYYKGLIRLRKKLPGLCDKSSLAAKRVTDRKIHGDGVVSFRVDNRSADDRADWDELFIIYNASSEDCEVIFPEGEWEILADGSDADCRKSVPETEKSIRVEAHCGMMLGKT